jgi:hypothetical protein
VFTSDIDVFVDKAYRGLDSIVNGCVGIQRPRVIVDRYLSSISANLVETGHDTNTHVVNAPFWNSTVQDSLQ